LFYASGHILQYLCNLCNLVVLLKYKLVTSLKPITPANVDMSTYVSQH